MTAERPRKYSKSDRTHEENQERAYIAASRRSDRSLEARMESARRASEIHKGRVGRGFKITEEAVLNEEMYEEEDPDFGLRLQRLHAALAADASWNNQQWLQGFNQPASYEPTPISESNPTQFPSYPIQPLPFFAYQPGSQPSNAPIRVGEPSQMFSNPVSPESSSPTFPEPGNMGHSPPQFQPTMQMWQAPQFSDPTYGYWAPSTTSPESYGENLRSGQFMPLQSQSLNEMIKHHDSRQINGNADGALRTSSGYSESPLANSDSSSSGASPYSYSSSRPSSGSAMMPDVSTQASTPLPGPCPPPLSRTPFCFSGLPPRHPTLTPPSNSLYEAYRSGKGQDEAFDGFEISGVPSESRAPAYNREEQGELAYDDWLTTPDGS